MIMIGMILIVVLLIVFFSIQLYVRVQLESLDSNDRKMKQKINFYKSQENNRAIIFLLAGAIIFCLLFAGIIYTQNSLRKDNKDLQMKMEDVEARATSTSALEVYKDNTLKLASFPWDKVVETTDNQSMINYELQLIREWQPFLGEANITIINSQNTKSLTLSVFSSSLSNEAYKTAVKNAEAFVKELNKAQQITMIDFNFTYRNEKDTLSKSTIVYSRPSKEGNLEKVNLDK